MRRDLAIISLILLITIRLAFPELVHDLKNNESLINKEQYLYNNSSIKNITQNASLSDEFNVHAINVDANKLLVDVSYKGCRPHSFELRCEGSDDTIVLMYNDIDEYCEDYIKESLAFELEELNTNVFNRNHYTLSVVNNRSNRIHPIELVQN